MWWRVLSWLAIAIFGAVAPATAGTLRLSNCTQSTPTVDVYNAADGFCWIPVLSGGTKTLPSCGTVTFNCEGDCKVKVQGAAFDCSNPHPMHLVTGEHVYIKPSSSPDATSIVPRDWIRDIDDWDYRCDCVQDNMQW